MAVPRSYKGHLLFQAVEPAAQLGLAGAQHEKRGRQRACGWMGRVGWVGSLQERPPKGLYTAPGTCCRAPCSSECPKLLPPPSPVLHLCSLEEKPGPL